MRPLIAATAIVLLSTYGALAEVPVPTARYSNFEQGPVSDVEAWPQARDAALKAMGVCGVPAYGTHEHTEFYRRFWQNVGELRDAGVGAIDVYNPNRPKPSC